VSRSEAIAGRACPDRKEAFARFIEDGTFVDGYAEHLDGCRRCQEAVEAVLDHDAKEFAEFAEKLDAELRVIDGGKKDELPPPVERKSYVFAAIVFLIFAAVLAITLSRCL
jgi:hypothetical protein